MELCYCQRKGGPLKRMVLKGEVLEKHEEKLVYWRNIKVLEEGTPTP